MRLLDRSANLRTYKSKSIFHVTNSRFYTCLSECVSAGFENLSGEGR